MLYVANEDHYVVCGRMYLLALNLLHSLFAPIFEGVE